MKSPYGNPQQDKFIEVVLFDFSMYFCVMIFALLSYGFIYAHNAKNAFAVSVLFHTLTIFAYGYFG
jgi:hypothetical protein